MTEQTLLVCRIGIGICFMEDTMGYHQFLGKADRQIVYPLGVKVLEVALRL